MQYFRKYFTKDAISGKKESERESSSRHDENSNVKYFCLTLVCVHFSLSLSPSLCYIMSSWIVVNFRAKYPLTGCQKYPPRGAWKCAFAIYATRNDRYTLRARTIHACKYAHTHHTLIPTYRECAIISFMRCNRARLQQRIDDYLVGKLLIYIINWLYNYINCVADRNCIARQKEDTQLFRRNIELIAK